MSILERLTGGMKKAATGLEGLRSDVEELRKRRIALIVERNSVSQAPMAAEEIAARVDAVVAEVARSARSMFDMEWLTGPNGTLAATHIPKLFEKYPASAQVLLGGADLLRERMLAAALSSLPSGAKQLSARERSAKLAEIDAAIDEAELMEERVIRHLYDLGVTFRRRADARPEIFLRERV